MTYKCPKGHSSTDSDYCSECGALIGQSRLSAGESVENFTLNKLNSHSNEGKETCPDCGTPRVGDARFCEVCRHDFRENKTGVAEAIIASQKDVKVSEQIANNDVKAEEGDAQNTLQQDYAKADKAPVSNIPEKEGIAALEKLNVVITVDKEKAASCNIETSIKPAAVDRVFPLDLEENLVGRRSRDKSIYPEIEINDPGVSHRHLKFIKEADGSFSVLELGSANGTELNGIHLLPGVKTAVKPGDQFAIGIWTQIKIEAR